MNHGTMEPMMNSTMHNMNSTMMDHSGHAASAGAHDLYFHFNTVAILLFKQININTTKEMIGACIVVLIVAILYEALKTFRDVLMKNSILDYSLSGKSGNSMLKSSHFIQTLLHGVQMFISYCLMMVFMTFNAWLCGSIILGAMIGYFFTSYKRTSVADINEHCS